MAIPSNWKQNAFNPATASENQIHADDVARKYGFRGGLVPGVVVYAYLTHPALEAWGARFLSQGKASIALKKPLYDGSDFETRVSPCESGYTGSVVSADGTLCADGEVALRTDTAEVTSIRGDPPAPDRETRPPATRAVMETLAEASLGSIRIQWRNDGELASYTRDSGAMPRAALGDPPRAHPGFALGLANWVLARNVRLGPWIHVQSDIEHVSAIELGDQTVTEARIVKLFAGGGHEFVDLDVNVYLDDGTPVMHADYRAIYLLKPRS